jgi:hypothetical protein
MVSLILFGLLSAQVAPAPQEPPPPPAPAAEPAPTLVTPAPPPPPPPAPALSTTPPPTPPPAVEPEAERAQPFHSSGNDAFGDVAPGGFTIRTLTQVRYRGTFTPALAGSDERATVQDNDGWRLNRVFFRLVAAPSKRVQARLLVDFAELLRKNQKKALKLAYGQFEPVKWLELTAGLFKRTFSLLELLPIADFELADEGPTDDFIKDLGYGGRDVGGSIRLSPLGKKRYLSLWLGAFAGDPEEGYDTSVGKLFTARLESRPYNFIRLGADFAWRTEKSVGHEKYPDYRTEITTLDPGKAGSADVTFSLLGFELRMEGLLGDRTDALWEVRSGHRDFVAGWALAAYRFPVGELVMMPAVRAEWLDVDRKNPGGGRLYLSAGFNVDISANVRLLLDVSRYDVQSAAQSLKERPWKMPASGPDYDVRVRDADWWSVTTQLQLKI